MSVQIKRYFGVLRTNFNDEPHCLSCLENLQSRPDLYSVLFGSSQLCAKCSGHLIPVTGKVKKEGRIFYILYEKNDFLLEKLRQYEIGHDVALKDLFVQEIPSLFKNQLKQKDCYVFPVKEESYLSFGAHPLEEIACTFFKRAWNPFYLENGRILLKKQYPFSVQKKIAFLKDEQEYLQRKEQLDSLHPCAIFLLMASKEWMKKGKNHS